MASVPTEYEDLLTEDVVGHISSLLPDGSPHTTPIWLDYDGEFLYCGGKKDTVRHRNVRSDPRVAISITDPDDPYRSLAIRGEVIDIAEAGAMEFIDALSQQYWGSEYPYDRTADRCILTIEITAVTARTIEPPSSDDD